MPISELRTGVNESGNAVSFRMSDIEDPYCSNKFPGKTFAVQEAFQVIHRDDHYEGRGGSFEVPAGTTMSFTQEPRGHYSQWKGTIIEFKFPDGSSKKITSHNGEYVFAMSGTIQCVDQTPPPSPKRRGTREVSRVERARLETRWKNDICPGANYFPRKEEHPNIRLEVDAFQKLVSICCPYINGHICANNRDHGHTIPGSGRPSGPIYGCRFTVGQSVHNALGGGDLRTEEQRRPSPLDYWRA